MIEQDWTERREKQLKTLQRLVAEAAEIDTISGIMDRLYFLSNLSMDSWTAAAAEPYDDPKSLEWHDWAT